MPPLVRALAHRTPFAGREKQLLRLHEELAAAGSDGPRAVFVSGEPGIGKSRLVAEFASRVQQDGVLVLFGRCDEDTVVPYQPVAEALWEYFSRDGGAGELLGVGGIWADISRILPGGANPANEAQRGTSVGSQRFTLFDAVSRLLAQTSRAQPVLLILEDLHWGDRPLLAMLRHVLRSPRGSRVLLAATFRDTEADEAYPLTQFLASIANDPRCARLSLGGLSVTDARPLLAGLESDETEPLVKLLVDRTAGNPFFMLQLIDHCRESGQLDATALAEGSVPVGVLEVVGQRLSQLSALGVDLLTTAAVVGDQFSVLVLSRTTDVPPEELLRALGESITAGLVYDSAATPGEMRFVHTIVRDALYARLSPHERSSRHAKIALAIESLVEEWPGAASERLAHHFSRSVLLGNAEKVVKYGTLAGDQAMKALAFEEAEAHYRTAMDAFELQAEKDLELRCELLLRLARAQSGAESADMVALGESFIERTVAMETFQTAAALADRLNRPSLVARAALESVGHWLEGTGAYGHSELTSIRLHELALSRLPVPASRERLLLLESLRGLYAAALRPLDRSRCVREAEHVASALGDEESLARAAFMTASEYFEECQYSAAVDAFDSCLSLCDAEDRRPVAVRALFLRMFSISRIGDSAGTDAAAAALRDAAVGARDHVMQTWAGPLYRGGVAVMAGDLEAAANWNFDAVKQAVDVGSRHLMVNAGAQRAAITDLVGRWDEAEPLWDSWEKSPSAFHPAKVAWSAARAGQTARAHRLFDRLERQSFTVPHDRLWVPLLAYLAEACALLQRRQASAEVLYEALAPVAHYAWDIGSPAFSHGSIERPIGMLASLMGRWEAAELHFDRALKFNSAVGHRPAAAETQLNHAQMLLSRGGPNDGRRARALLLRARAEAQDISLAPLLEQVEQTLRKLPRRGSQKANPFGLSTREVEVLALIARGLTNEEIAAELTVSTATVATHVHHILQETGSSNRAQAATLAADYLHQ